MAVLGMKLVTSWTNQQSHVKDNYYTIGDNGSVDKDNVITEEKVKELGTYMFDKNDPYDQVDPDELKALNMMESEIQRQSLQISYDTGAEKAVTGKVSELLSHKGAKKKPEGTATNTIDLIQAQVFDRLRSSQSIQSSLAKSLEAAVLHDGVVDDEEKAGLIDLKNFLTLQKRIQFSSTNVKAKFLNTLKDLTNTHVFLGARFISGVDGHFFRGGGDKEQDKKASWAYPDVLRVNRGGVTIVRPGMFNSYDSTTLSFSDNFSNKLHNNAVWPDYIAFSDDKNQEEIDFNTDSGNDAKTIEEAISTLKNMLRAKK